MKLRHQLIMRCLSAAALLLGLFGTLMIQLFFHLQLSREQEALSAQSASTAQSLEAAAVSYALQNIPLSDDMLVSLLSSLNDSASLCTSTGTLLDGSSSLPALTEGIHQRGRELFAVRQVHLRGEEYLLHLPASLDALYESRALLLTLYAALYLLLIGIFTVIMQLAARHIVRPLERLSDISCRLSDGEMKLRADAGGAYEIESLSHAFNRMADTLTGEIECQNRFIADLTHELKTPLTAMIGHADLIRSGRLQNEDAQLSAHQIVKEGQRLNALSARLIDLILLKNDALTLCDVFAASILEDTLSAFAPDAAARNIDFSMKCDDALISVDPALMRVVINNLTDNALKSDARSVQLEGIFADGTFTFRVRDDGRGMDEEALKRVTEPFYRVDKSRSRLQGGAGLGLSLCRQIAELHGSSLIFESRPAHGTIVSLSIPAKEVSADEEA